MCALIYAKKLKYKLKILNSEWEWEWSFNKQLCYCPVNGNDNMDTLDLISAANQAFGLLSGLITVYNFAVGRRKRRNIDIKPNLEWTLCYIPLWNSYQKYRKSNFSERTQNSDKSAFEWTMCYIPIEGTKN